MLYIAYIALGAIYAKVCPRSTDTFLPSSPLLVGGFISSFSCQLLSHRGLVHEPLYLRVLIAGHSGKEHFISHLVPRASILCFVKSVPAHSSRLLCPG